MKALGRQATGRRGVRVLFLVIRLAPHGASARQRRPRPGVPPPQVVVQQPRIDLDAPVALAAVVP